MENYRILFNLLFAVLLFLIPGRGMLAEERHEDHEALRALMRTAIEALNSRNLDLLAPSIYSNFVLITVDNQKLTSLDALKNYWNGLFSGDKPLLKQIEVRPKADELTVFLSDTTGVTNGASEDVYHFTDGDVRIMQSRWTVVVQKNNDRWQIARVHFSADITDNPLLEATRRQAYRLVGMAAGAGLVVGIGLMWLLRRRPKPA